MTWLKADCELYQRLARVEIAGTVIGCVVLVGFTLRVPSPGLSGILGPGPRETQLGPAAHLQLIVGPHRRVHGTSVSMAVAEGELSSWRLAGTRWVGALQLAGAGSKYRLPGPQSNSEAAPGPMTGLPAPPP